MFRRAAVVAIGLVLTTSPLALAQSDLTHGGFAPPSARATDGIIRTPAAEADVREAERAAGLAPRSLVTKREVEEEVDKLLRQTDDRRSTGSKANPAALRLH